jgi:hypothetical protein
MLPEKERAQAEEPVRLVSHTTPCKYLRLLQNSGCPLRWTISSVEAYRRDS